ncbi:MAG: UDP-glucose/GDP-mannose dehydrogenase family protein, partial [Chloroflexi bacterium]|nr:UDP-glucose/GDP-mannose dehydrogenase family protein [Chloroflexota bacterium]
ADKTIGLLGLSFKPNTDDMREAASLEVVHLLAHEGARLKGYDPVAMPVAARVLPQVTLCATPYDLAQDADGLVVVTEWNEFRQLDMARLKTLMRQPVLVDGRNIYDPAEMARLGFVYRGVGRGA